MLVPADYDNSISSATVLRVHVYREKSAETVDCQCGDVTTDGITKLKKHLFVTAGSFIVTLKSNHNSGIANGINLRTTGTYNCMVAV